MNPNDQTFPKPPFTPADMGIGFPGLTKREYFAAMAMQGIVAGISRFHEHIEGIIINRPDDISELACLYADALIAELSKVKSQ